MERPEEQRRVMRMLNDTIREILVEFASENGEFMCECGGEGCAERVHVSLRAYAAVRPDGDDAILLSDRHAGSML